MRESFVCDSCWHCVLVQLVQCVYLSFSPQKAINICRPLCHVSKQYKNRGALQGSSPNNHLCVSEGELLSALCAPTDLRSGSGLLPSLGWKFSGSAHFVAWYSRWIQGGPPPPSTHSLPTSVSPLTPIYPPTHISVRFSSSSPSGCLECASSPCQSRVKPCEASGVCSNGCIKQSWCVLHARAKYLSIVAKRTSGTRVERCGWWRSQCWRRRAKVRFSFCPRAGLLSISIVCWRRLRRIQGGILSSAGLLGSFSHHIPCTWYGFTLRGILFCSGWC